MLSRLRAAVAAEPSPASPTHKGASLEEKAAAVRAGVADLLTDAPALRFVDDTCLRRYLAARSGSVTKAVKALR
jgi:hypothetical protein